VLLKIAASRFKKGISYGIIISLVACDRIEILPKAFVVIVNGHIPKQQWKGIHLIEFRNAARKMQY